MVSGAIQGISGAVIQMYETLAEQEKTEPQLLLSGGDAATLNTYLAYKLPVTIEIVEPLVLDGLILILKEKMQHELGHL
jgi:pantothenate kinase type III